MILRKPYAFFIKMFKPIHIALALMTSYLIYLSNNILSFLNGYIYSDASVTGQALKSKFISGYLYIIPIIIIIFSLLIMSIMFKKKKSYTFYVINIFAFILILIINLYTANFIGVLEKNIVSIKMVKLIHDLQIINIIIQSIAVLFFIVRGMGVNFKKFNFDSDISKIAIADTDNEEFELNINVDLNESKRKRKRKLRYLKYKYLENKFLINLIIGVFLLLIGIIISLVLIFGNKPNREGKVYSLSDFNLMVESTSILNEDYKGNKLTNNYLVVINCKLNSNFPSVSLYLKDFKLKIGNATFDVITKYSKSLIDIGETYKESILETSLTNYLFVYEIPKKYISSDMKFVYSNQGNSFSVKLSPNETNFTSKDGSKKIGENISFNNTLGNINFKINSYEISDKFLIEYNYCVKDDDCILSKEYLRPSINENFDKFIIKFNVNYNDESTLNLNNFYEFFDKFASIYYMIGDKWYYQNSNFEEILSNKLKDSKTVYIGVNSKIASATSIKLVFLIRHSKYEYILK